MKHKKAQIAIFVLMGLILLIAFSFFFYIRSENISPEIEKATELSFEFSPVKNYIETCLENELDEILHTISVQGGYLYNPKRELMYNLNALNETLQAPYYIYDNQFIAISLEDLENEISSGLKYSIYICTENITVFPYMDIQVSNGNSGVQTIVNKDSVNALITLPTTVKIDNTIKNIDKFRISKNSNLYKLYETAINISKEQYQIGKKICLTCLAEIANKRNISINTQEFEDEDSYIIVYYLENLDPNDENLIFQFAHKFRFENSSILPTIKEIDELETVIGYGFSYSINAIGNDLIFFDDTDLFNIDNKSGLIEFTPKYDDLGKHLITITVKDKDNKTNEEVFRLNIKGFGYKPTIEYPGYLEAYVEKFFSYKVDASSPDDNELFFIDDSDLFNIDIKSGFISFIPQASQIGVHNFNITAIDENGNYDLKEFTLIINDQDV